MLRPRFLLIKYLSIKRWNIMLSISLNICFGCLKEPSQWDGSFDYQGSHRLEKYLNIQNCLEKSLKIKFALKSTWKTLKGLEKSLNFYHLQEEICWLVGWFCCFTSQVNSYGHCGTVSSPNHTFFLGRLEQAVNQLFVHILSLVTDNNPSWMNQRKGGEWP